MGYLIAYVLMSAFYSGAIYAIEKKYERKLNEIRIEFDEKIRELKADKGISYGETKRVDTNETTIM